MEAPTQLNAYPWLQETWQQLLQQHANRNTTGSLLLSGAAGIGKGALLRRYAMTLLCEQPNHTHGACGACQGCQFWQKNAHPDYQEIMPEGNTTQRISIDPIRTMQEWSVRKSVNGGARVVAIYQAETLNTNAANALLKTLEEPHQNCYFLLTTNIYYQLLPTIKSRTERIRVPSPSYQQMNEKLHTWLDESDTKITDEIATMALDFSNHNLNTLRDLITGNGHQILGECVYSIGKMLAHKQAPLLPNTLAEQLKSTPTKVLDTYLWIVAHLVSIATGVSSDMLDKLNPQTQVQWQYLARSVTTARLFGAHDKLVAMRAQLLSGINPNLELALSELLCDWRNNHDARVKHAHAQNKHA